MAVTYDVQKKKFFYPDVTSEKSKIAVIFPGNGIGHEIYLAGEHTKAFLQKR